MKRSVSAKTRRLVAERANYRCEYCQLHEDDLFLSFEIDHVISVKHGGGNELANLAYACPHCNNHKGSDLTTFLDSYDDIVILFNPRIHKWNEHFSSDKGQLIAKTRIGQASIKLLRLNEPDLIILRQLLTQVGRYK
ncbi:HNH endonuclease [Spirosoma validum]|uniref:HNH endonuclease n=1 Tax=Spirosoma validum TaxID=2771355 RepID=A0A927B8C9_9BACT|nr:HNH endonuclease signature motif containing protein [Spirosoma validum]MBD2757067.1 HNH endonuclease [Spirosoma validum]